ncbi:MAG: hypothetical protein HBSAPP03_07410 [Phycisphaerae bacterium]|nr:MAG: hypothetical protein HBSAPP03_07410 [Phycisphaerae bacterium]
MPPIRSIAILFHERHRGAEGMNYRIWAIAANWRAAGIKVDPVWGPSRQIDADLLIPHLDVSYIPDDYWAVIQRHPNVVNRRVRDIRKAAYSVNIVKPGDSYDGPVIVKTNGNCGGNFDEWLEGGGRPVSLPARALRRLKQLPVVERRRLGSARTLARYYLFDSPRQVPRAAFANPHLVVEKFLPERRDGRYICRLWNFLGDRSLGRILSSEEPIVKSWNSTMEERTEVPPEIAAWRDRLGVDYGKIDYVIHNGVPVLIDVNTTPTVTGPILPRHVERSAVLAEGLAAFADQAMEASSRIRSTSSSKPYPKTDA